MESILQMEQLRLGEMKWPPWGQRSRLLSQASHPIHPLPKSSTLLPHTVPS